MILVSERVDRQQAPQQKPKLTSGSRVLSAHYSPPRAEAAAAAGAEGGGSGDFWQSVDELSKLRGSMIDDRRQIDGRSAALVDSLSSAMHHEVWSGVEAEATCIFGGCGCAICLNAKD